MILYLQTTLSLPCINDYNSKSHYNMDIVSGSLIVGLQLSQSGPRQPPQTTYKLILHHQFP
jgi:hypothetical protein